MSNTHEYTVFSRDALEKILDMKWGDPRIEGLGSLDEDVPTQREFVASYVLKMDTESMSAGDRRELNQFMARETIRRSFRTGRVSFFMLYLLVTHIEYHTPHPAYSVDIDSCQSCDDLMACAAIAVELGLITKSTCRAVEAIHCGGPDSPMIPGLPSDVLQGADGLGLVQARKFLDFVVRAWEGNWPIEHGKRRNRTIREHQEYGKLASRIRSIPISRPCAYRWYES